MIGQGCWLYSTFGFGHYLGPAITSDCVGSQVVFPDMVVPLVGFHNWAGLWACSAIAPDDVAHQAVLPD